MIEPLPLIELIPTSELYVDMRVMREEECQRCKQHTNHEYVLRSVTPRFWTYQCTECRKPNGESHERS